MHCPESFPRLSGKKGFLTNINFALRPLATYFVNKNKIKIPFGQNIYLRFEY